MEDDEFTRILEMSRREEEERQQKKQLEDTAVTVDLKSFANAAVGASVTYYFEKLVFSQGVRC